MRGDGWLAPFGGLSALLAVAATATVAEAVVWSTARAGRPVGDEAEYLRRAEADDPLAPEPFLRMPLLPLLGAGIHRVGARPDRWLPVTGAVASATSVVLAAATAGLIAGPAAATAAGLALALLPERLVLAAWIWPDTFIGLSCASVALSVVAGAPPLLTGMLTAAGFAVRVDGVALAIGAAAADAFVSHQLAPVRLACIVGPTLGLGVLMTLRNHRRYGIALPESTFRFNLGVAVDESRRGGAVQHAVRRTSRRWDSRTQQLVAATDPERVAVPVHVRSFVRRALGLFGPETFASARLFDSRPPARVARSLRYGFPAVAAIAIAAAPHAAGVGPAVAASAPLAIAASAAHTRTRFRMGFLSVIGVVAGVGIARFREVATSTVGDDDQRRALAVTLTAAATAAARDEGT